MMALSFRIICFLQRASKQFFSVLLLPFPKNKKIEHKPNSAFDCTRVNLVNFIVLQSLILIEINLFTIINSPLFYDLGFQVISLIYLKMSLSSKFLTFFVLVQSISISEASEFGISIASVSPIQQYTVQCQFQCDCLSSPPLDVSILFNHHYLLSTNKFLLFSALFFPNN